jgi:hypothetical protein
MNKAGAEVKEAGERKTMLVETTWEPISLKG